MSGVFFHHINKSRINLEKVIFIYLIDFIGIYLFLGIILYVDWTRCPSYTCSWRDYPDTIMEQKQINEPKPQFSGQQTFPLRQLWLKKVYEKIIEFPEKTAPKSLFTNANSIITFGVGKNMVQSINHWSLATDFVYEYKNNYRPTEIAEILFGENGLDEYQESAATAWLIHWKLAGEAKKTTTWSWLFNQTTNPILDKELLLKNLKLYAEKLDYRIAITTLKKDLDCCLRSYTKGDGKESPEEISESVLSEINILSQIDRGKFEFIRGEKPNLPNGIFYYALLKFWEKPEYAQQNSMSFNNIVHADNSPGRVFKLDELSVADRLSQIEDQTNKKLIWTDSQGIRSVSRVGDINPMDVLRLAYE